MGTDQYGIYTSESVIEGWRLKGMKDGLQGNQPRPPLRFECCAAYWKAWRTANKEREKKR